MDKRKEINMKYSLLQTQPKDLEKKLNVLAEQGWKVVSSSESAWVINKCCGLSHTVDSIVNVILSHE